MANFHLLKNMLAKMFEEKLNPRIRGILYVQRLKKFREVIGWHSLPTEISLRSKGSMKHKVSLEPSLRRESEEEALC